MRSATHLNSKDRRLRLAVLFSHPIQYFAPLMRALASQSDIDLTVYYCSRKGVVATYDKMFMCSFKWDTPLLEGYQSVFLPNIRQGDSTDGFFRLVNPKILGELVRGQFDAILVHGYDHLTNWLAILGAGLVGTKVILRGDSHLLNEHPWHIRAAKNLILRPLLQSISCCACIGKANHDYYRHYGVPEQRLFFAPYVVDNEFFQAEEARLRPMRTEIRAALGIADGVSVVLACGKIYSVKQPLVLLRAYQMIRRNRPCALIYAGDGPMRSDIERVVSEDEIPGVIITGFVNQKRIGELYIASDMLALPSISEKWGLVVNEAMNFGLPVVVSDRVGCAADLVHSGENGFVVSHNCISALSNALENLVSDPIMREQFGRRSRELIESYSPEVFVQTLTKAIQKTLTND